MASNAEEKFGEVKSNQSVVEDINCGDLSEILNLVNASGGEESEPSDIAEEVKRITSDKKQKEQKQSQEVEKHSSKGKNGEAPQERVNSSGSDMQAPNRHTRRSLTCPPGGAFSSSGSESASNSNSDDSFDSDASNRPAPHLGPVSINLARRATVDKKKRASRKSRGDLGSGSQDASGHRGTIQRSNSQSSNRSTSSNRLKKNKTVGALQVKQEMKSNKHSRGSGTSLSTDYMGGPSILKRSASDTQLKDDKDKEKTHKRKSQTGSQYAHRGSNATSLHHRGSNANSFQHRGSQHQVAAHRMSRTSIRVRNDAENGMTERKSLVRAGSTRDMGILADAPAAPSAVGHRLSTLSRQDTREAPDRNSRLSTISANCEDVVSSLSGDYLRNSQGSARDIGMDKRVSTLDMGKRQSILVSNNNAVAAFQQQRSKMDNLNQLGSIEDGDEETQEITSSRRGQCLSNTKMLIWVFTEEPFATKTTSAFAYLMVVAIVVSVCQSWDVSPPTAKIDPFDYTFGTLFTLEVVTRLKFCPKLRLFLVNPANTIDSVALLPWILIDVLQLHVNVWEGFAILNVFQPLLRLLKLCRYFWGWDLLFHALRESSRALVIPLFFLLTIVFFGACTMLTFEGVWKREEMDDEDVEERLLRNKQAGGSGDIDKLAQGIMTLPDALHYCVISVVSIAVGEVYDMRPRTTGARGMAVLLMIIGVLFLSMPIAIVGACFSEAWFDQDRIILLNKVRGRIAQHGHSFATLREVFDDVDEDGSGEVEFDEFQHLCEAFHLQLSVAKIRRLFNYFDADMDGTISYQDFVCSLYPEHSFDVEDLMDYDDYDDEDMNTIDEEDSEGFRDSRESGWSDDENEYTEHEHHFMQLSGKRGQQSQQSAGSVASADSAHASLRASQDSAASSTSEIEKSEIFSGAAAGVKSEVWSGAANSDLRSSNNSEAHKQGQGDAAGGPGELLRVSTEVPGDGGSGSRSHQTSRDSNRSHDNDKTSSMPIGSFGKALIKVTGRNSQPTRNFKAAEEGHSPVTATKSHKEDPGTGSSGIKSIFHQASGRQRKSLTAADKTLPSGEGEADTAPVRNSNMMPTIRNSNMEMGNQKSNQVQKTETGQHKEKKNMFFGQTRSVGLKKLNIQKKDAHKEEPEAAHEKKQPTKPEKGGPLGGIFAAERNAFAGPHAGVNPFSSIADRNETAGHGDGAKGSGHPETVLEKLARLESQADQRHEELKNSLTENQRALGRLEAMMTRVLEATGASKLPPAAPAGPSTAKRRTLDGGNLMQVAKDLESQKTQQRKSLSALPSAGGFNAALKVQQSGGVLSDLTAVVKKRSSQEGAVNPNKKRLSGIVMPTGVSGTEEAAGDSKTKAQKRRSVAGSTPSQNSLQVDDPLGGMPKRAHSGIPSLSSNGDGGSGGQKKEEGSGDGTGSQTKKSRDSYHST